MTRVVSESESVDRCFEELERRIVWALARRKLMATVCRQVCDEDRGPIHMDHSEWANDPFLNWSDLKLEHDPELVLEEFAGIRAFEADVDDGEPAGAGRAEHAEHDEHAEVDELLVGVAVACFVDPTEINRWLGERRFATWGDAGTLVELLAPCSTVERLKLLTRLHRGAPLAVDKAFSADKRHLSGSVRCVESLPLEPGAGARRWIAALAKRPMRRLEVPRLEVIAPWTKPADEGWDDGELVASLVRELALRTAIRTAWMANEVDLQREEIYGCYEEDREVFERLEVFKLRLAAAKVERAARMAKSSKPLGFQRLVREHDLSETEAEVLLVVAALELLGKDGEVAVEIGETSWKRTWQGREMFSSVGAVSSLLTQHRASRLAVRELLRPTGRLVSEGLVTVSPLEPAGPWLDPATGVELTPRAAAIISGVEALAEFIDEFEDERGLREEASWRARF